MKMDEMLGAVAEKLERIEASLREYRDDSVRWRKTQEYRNNLRNASIAKIGDALEGVEISLAARQRKTLSVPEAARYANVKQATVRRWLADGQLKGTKVGGVKQSRWRIRRHDLDAFLERATNSPG